MKHRRKKNDFADLVILPVEWVVIGMMLMAIIAGL